VADAAPVWVRRRWAEHRARPLPSARERTVRAYHARFTHEERGAGRHRPARDRPVRPPV